MNEHGTSFLKWSFVGPTLLFLIAFNIFPLCYNIVLSFTDKQMTAPTSTWVGGRNYDRMFNTEDHPEFARSLRTTAVFVTLAVSVELALGFLLALGLRGEFRGKTIVLNFLLIPMMLSPMVMGLYWTTILNGNFGLLNQVLAGIGLPEPQWTTDLNLKLISILMIDVWMWTPFMMLIALAGLNSIPTHLYEAAEIDRASAWTVFTRITLPLCAPLLGLAALLRTTDALKQFDLVMAITGPNEAATQTLSALLYKILFGDQKIGIGSAFSCLVLVIVIALATVFTRYLDRQQRRMGRTAG